MRKTCFEKIYTNDSPLPYFETLTPIDYGFAHNELLSMLNSYFKDNFRMDTKEIKFVELGSSYGNTTLAYRCSSDWDAVGETWKTPEKLTTSGRKLHVSAVDLSSKALQYGLAKGIFDSIFVYDVNSMALSCDIGSSLTEAEILVFFHSSFYFTLPALKQIFSVFLRGRALKKMICYNWLCTFDSQRNLTPEVLFQNESNWSYIVKFCKHRDFTEEELPHYGGSKEAWTFIYIVTFYPID